MHICKQMITKQIPGLTTQVKTWRNTSTQNPCYVSFFHLDTLLTWRLLFPPFPLYFYHIVCVLKQQSLVLSDFEQYVKTYIVCILDSYFFSSILCLEYSSY